MNKLKRIIGILCMIAGPVVLAMLVISAFQNIGVATNSEIRNPVPWIIIIAVFTPIAIGLMIFGWYAWKGEYERLAERSEEL
jgi:Ni/Fe-hydrogenase subunit HybB-like protein